MQKSQVQLLLNLLQKLYRIKSSFIFREPVDPVLYPDYRSKIAQPIDLSTIIEKLLTAQYITPAAVRDDLLLMISNCRQYNSDAGVLKVTDTLAESIDSAWLKFQASSSQCPAAPLTYCPRILEQLKLKNAKFMGRDLKAQLAREQHLEILPSILPPLHISLFLTDEDKLSQKFPYSPEKYVETVKKEDFSSAKFSLSVTNLQQIYAKNAEKKRRKYRKLLMRAIKWLNNTIFLKCIQRHPDNSSASQYLVNLSESGNIAQQLKLYTLSNFFRLSLIWFKHYSFLLSSSVQIKFVSTCHDAIRCIRNSLKYITQVSDQDVGLSSQNHMAILKERIEKDERSTLKKYLKIEIRRRDEIYGLRYTHDEEFANLSKRDQEIEREERRKRKEQMQIVKREESVKMQMETEEWLNPGQKGEKVEKAGREENRGLSRSSRSMSSITMCQQFQDREAMLERKKKELEEDEMFLHTHYRNYNPEMIRVYAQMLVIDWQSIHERKLPRQLQLDFSALSLGFKN